MTTINLLARPKLTHKCTMSTYSRRPILKATIATISSYSLIHFISLIAMTVISTTVYNPRRHTSLSVHSMTRIKHYVKLRIKVVIKFSQILS